MKKTTKSWASRRRLPDKASELLVNQRMLEAHRDEIRAEIRAHDRRFDAIDKQFEVIDNRFEAMDAKFDSMEAKNESFREKMSADMHRVVALVEEQRNLNLVVLEGYQSLYDRQDRVEKRLDDIDLTLLTLKKVSP